MYATFYGPALTAGERIDLGHRFRKTLRSMRDSGFTTMPMKFSETDLENLIVAIADDAAWGVGPSTLRQVP